jgi:hypothetical protein
MAFGGALAISDRRYRIHSKKASLLAEDKIFAKVAVEGKAS